MAKYQTWHVWIEFQEPGISFPVFHKIEVQAPSNFEACTEAAQLFAEANGLVPLSAYAYDVGYNNKVQPQKFKSKVVYEVDRTPEPASNPRIFDKKEDGFV